MGSCMQDLLAFQRARPFLALSTATSLGNSDDTQRGSFVRAALTGNSLSTGIVFVKYMGYIVVDLGGEMNAGYNPGDTDRTGDVNTCSSPRTHIKHARTLTTQTSGGIPAPSRPPAGLALPRPPTITFRNSGSNGSDTPFCRWSLRMPAHAITAALSTRRGQLFAE